MKPDFKKIVTENNELYKMVDIFVPKTMQPKVFPGFEGFQLSDPEYLIKLMSPDRFLVPLTMSPISSIVDIGTMAKLAGSKIFDDMEDAYVIFIRKGMPWGCTFFTLITDMYKIHLAGLKGTDYASSKNGLTEAARLAKEFCGEVFSADVEEILRLTNQTLREIM